MKIRELAAARAGDKGSTLDITLVAFNQQAYDTLVEALTEDYVGQLMHRSVPGPVIRHLVPGLLAIKYVMPQALEGGIYASVRAGIHWQKAAIWLLLDEDVPQ